MSGAKRRLGLFEGYGIEAEYMIVDRNTLKVRPICDVILAEMAGEPARLVEQGAVAWSNELVMHVIELKANGPAPDLKVLHGEFSKAISAMNQRLAHHGAMLLPTAMHPFFDPKTETKLWSNEDSIIYATYDRIFGCSGHGWSNLQSLHINLPFADDEEFGKLHAAIRLMLPILPAVAASSPVVEGKRGEYLDSRLSFYLQNQRRIPSIIGPVIPEAVFTAGDYQSRILEPMYRDIAPHDPDEILQEEWLNSRAAIARFERNAIEIRLVDIGECPQADFAVIAATVGALKALVAEKWSGQRQQRRIGEDFLRETLLGTLRHGLNHELRDAAYLEVFGLSGKVTVGEVWGKIIEAAEPDAKSMLTPLQMILRDGPVGERILRRVGSDVSAATLLTVYRELASCLAEDRLFV